MKTEGRIFQAMKQRLNEQKACMNFFIPDKPILDLGCGFGRQAFMFAKDGFCVVGVDNSEVFIEIANAIFAKHRLNGSFFCSSIFDFYPNKKFEQILLLDVFEHIKPLRRRRLLKHIAQHICSEKGKLLITFPFMPIDGFGITQKIQHFLKGIMCELAISDPKQEHPYPVPNRKNFEWTCKNLFSIVDYKVNVKTVFYLVKPNKPYFV